MSDFYKLAHDEKKLVSKNSQTVSLVTCVNIIIQKFKEISQIGKKQFSFQFHLVKSPYHVVAGHMFLGKVEYKLLHKDWANGLYINLRISYVCFLLFLYSCVFSAFR